MQKPVPKREFNKTLVESIDETITTLLSREVVDALYVHLQNAYSISSDEVPHRLETLLSTLEKTFGRPSSETICKAIAKKFYAKLDLTFYGNPGGTLLDYVEEAKIKLQERESKP
ncbi:MAG TPA: hypothetical protein VJ044_10190 [Candidatus Hodarchaeales archaeon]|nr:hypothetical protein [Candidatus Hodarchaeales archaeon]